MHKRKWYFRENVYSGWPSEKEIGIHHYFFLKSLGRIHFIFEGKTLRSIFSTPPLHPQGGVRFTSDILHG